MDREGELDAAAGSSADLRSAVVLPWRRAGGVVASTDTQSSTPLVDDAPLGEPPHRDVPDMTDGNAPVVALVHSTVTPSFTSPAGPDQPVQRGFGEEPDGPVDTPDVSAAEQAGRPTDARSDDGIPLGASNGGETLTHHLLVRSPPGRPTAGWRAAVYKLSGGTLNPGPSREEGQKRQQLERIRTPLAHPHSIVVLSMKGGVGKTTVAALLGLVLAADRGDQVVALDADPDAGTLADRLLGRSPATSIRDLAAATGSVQNPTDLARYTTLVGRLHVLSSEHDPAQSASFDQHEYERVITVLRRFFHVLITDSGTGVSRSATTAALTAARSVVVVGGPTVDGASRASKTLDWLRASGHGDLAANAVVALSADRTSPEVDPDAVKRHLDTRCRAVVTIPSDPHLATGGLIELARLRAATYDSALQLTAVVADGFPRPELAPQ